MDPYPWMQIHLPTHTFTYIYTSRHLYTHKHRTRSFIHTPTHTYGQIYGHT